MCSRMNFIYNLNHFNNDIFDAPTILIISTIIYLICFKDMIKVKICIDLIHVLLWVGVLSSNALFNFHIV